LDYQLLAQVVKGAVRHNLAQHCLAVIGWQRSHSFWRAP